MTQEPLTEWSHAIVDIPKNGLARVRDLTPAERSAVANALGMVSLASVTSSYRIEHLAGGGYRLKGRVAADGEQACVVSLEPIAAHLDEAFDVEFWPELETNEGGEDKTILDDREVEPLTGGAIPVGRIVYETISAALDPYPRKDGATFNWTDQPPDNGKKVSPFAALAKLKGSSE
jgi:uncharacterized metal-binding protein YceD (DUF177 family)